MKNGFLTKFLKFLQFGHHVTRTKVLVEDFGISFVERDDDGKILAVHCDISVADIDTEEKVRKWIAKLSKKPWITREHITDFIAGCNRLYPMINFVAEGLK